MENRFDWLRDLAENDHEENSEVDTPEIKLTKTKSTRKKIV